MNKLMPDCSNILTMHTSARRYVRIVGAVLLGATGACSGDRVLQTAPVAETPRTNVVNLAPVAMFTVSPRWPQPGDTVTFNASFSTDRDGVVQAYEWTLGNGTSQVSGPVARAVYDRVGTYAVGVTVVDDSGSRHIRTLDLVVSANAPTAPLSATQSVVAVGSLALLPEATTVVTVTARSTLGLPVPNSPVWISAGGQQIAITQPATVTSALGVATAVVSSARAQTVQLYAIADYVLLTSTPVMLIAAGSVQPTLSTTRLTDPRLSASGDSTLLEVTARDAQGNPIAGASVTVSVTGGTATIRNEGPTDSDGRRVVTILPTICGSATFTLRASVNGIAVASPSTLIADGLGVYGLCGAALWLDATDATTITETSGAVTQWRDKSGAARHATGAAATSPTRIMSGVLKNMLRFDGTDFLSLPGLANATMSGVPFTVIAVERRRIAGSGYLLGGSSANALAMGYSGSTAGALTVGSGNTLSSSTGAAFGTVANQPIRIWSARWNGSRLSMLVNNNLEDNRSNNDGITSWVSPMIGRHISSYYSGDIGEVIVFTRALTDNERETLTLSLMGKWGAGSLSIESSQSPNADAGTTPNTAPRVRLSDGNGNGIPNVSMAWQVTSGGGRVGGLTTYNGLTDASGYLNAVSWTLDAGTNQLTAWQMAVAGEGPSQVFTGTGQLPATPVQHLDAQLATTFTTNVSAISAWRDRNGNGRNLAQTTTASQPTLIDNGINGRPSVRFDGSDDFLIGGPSPTMGITGARSVFVVVRTSATPTNGACTDGSGQYLIDRYTLTSDPPLTSIKSVNGRWVLQTRLNDGGSLGCAPASVGAAIVNNSTTIFEMVQSTTAISVFGNGVQQGSNLSISGTNTMQPISLGRHGTAGPSLNGMVGEIMIFGSALSAADRLRVERYLGWKWGVTVP
jgi:hypothetical protein